MAAIVDKSRSVDGVNTSLVDVGYVSVGMDDGFQQCNCSTPQGPYPHSLHNVTCSVNDCRAGRCTWHNQTDGSPMIDTIRFPDLKALVAHAHALKLAIGFYLNTCICMEKVNQFLHFSNFLINTTPAVLHLLIENVISTKF